MTELKGKKIKKVGGRDQLIFRPDYNNKVLIIDGKKYRHVKTVTTKDDHAKKVIYERVKDETIYRGRIKDLADYLIKESGIKIENVLINILRSMTVEEFEKLEKKREKKVKVRVGKGCLYLKMGNAEITLID